MVIAFAGLSHAFTRRRLAKSSAVAALLVMSGLALPAHAADVAACTVVLDQESGETLHRDGDCEDRFYPQSTFKLPLAMMGYDAGILTGPTAPRWDYKTEWKRPERERKAVDPTIWERDSIVWYSQEITRRLGSARFADYIAKLEYGNRDVTGGPGGTDGLTESWLMSSLTISADEQADFIRRFRTGVLPISRRAAEMTETIVPSFEAADGWIIHGKTGSGRLRDKAGEPAQNRPLGWFVGWAEKGDRKLVFARVRVADRNPKGPISFEVRDSLIADLPKLVDER